MAEKSAFIFVCDLATESECLTKELMGGTQASAVWALNIRPSDSIYLFNFNTRVIRGPYTAVSSADCHDTSAWCGKFPVQVKVARSSLTKVADSHLPGAPAALLRKRPPHVLGAHTASELLSWIQAVGQAEAVEGQ